jgi:hypothetical protein
MNVSLGERLFVPAALAALFSLMSRGFMGVVGGSTRRMRTVWLCSVAFITGSLYCIAWQDKLASLIGWKDAWIGASILLAMGSAYLCRTLLIRAAKVDDSGANVSVTKAVTHKDV